MTCDPNTATRPLTEPQAAGCALVTFSGATEITAFHELIGTTTEMPGFDLLLIAGGPCEIDVAVGAAASEIIILQSLVVLERGKFSVTIPCSVPAYSRLSCRVYADRKRAWPTDWVAVSVEGVTDG